MDPSNNQTPPDASPSNELPTNAGTPANNSPSSPDPTPASPVSPSEPTTSFQPQIIKATTTLKPGEVSSSHDTISPEAPGVIANPAPPLSGNQPGPGLSAQPFVNEVTPMPAVAASPKKKFPMKMVGILVVVLILLGGGSAVAYFGYVLPNNPDHLWTQALSNGAKGYSKLLDYSDTLKTKKSSEVKGTFSLTGPVKTDGHIDVKSDDKNATITTDFGIKGVRVTVDVIAIKNDLSIFPDTYIRLGGVSGVSSLLGAGSTLDKYNSQWIFVDHTITDSLNQATNQAGNTSKLNSLTRQDFIDISRSAGTTFDQYLFTNKQDKAALKITKKIGWETVDGRKQYHYQASVNKDNLKDFVKAFKAQLKTTKLGTLLGSDYDKVVNIDGILKSIDSYKNNDTIDIWVDKGTQLVRKFKITDAKVSDNWFALSLNYNGGAEYPFVLETNNKTDGITENLNIGFDINAQSNSSKITANAYSKGTGGSDFTFKADLTVTPGDNAINVQKPAKFKTLTEVINGIFGTGPVLGKNTTKPWPSAITGLTRQE